jgi:hypothetical protein
MNSHIKALVLLALVGVFVFIVEPPVWKRPSVSAWKTASLDKLRASWYSLEQIDWSKDPAQVDADLVRLINEKLNPDPLTKEPFVVLPSIRETMKIPAANRRRIPIIVSKQSQKAKGHTTLYADGSVGFVGE